MLVGRGTVTELLHRSGGRGGNVIGGVKVVVLLASVVDVELGEKCIAVEVLLASVVEL